VRRSPGRDEQMDRVTRFERTSFKYPTFPISLIYRKRKCQRNKCASQNRASAFSAFSELFSRSRLHPRVSDPPSANGLSFVSLPTKPRRNFDPIAVCLPPATRRRATRKLFGDSSAPSRAAAVTRRRILFYFFLPFPSAARSSLSAREPVLLPMPPGIPCRGITSMRLAIS